MAHRYCILLSIGKVDVAVLTTVLQQLCLVNDALGQIHYRSPL